MHSRSLFVLLLATLMPATLLAQRGGGPPGPQQTSTPEPLKFRYMGPAAAGRIATVAGVPGDPNTYYLGSASGGVWKSTDAGQTFVPIFDDQTRRRDRRDRRRRLAIRTSSGSAPANRG